MTSLEFNSKEEYLVAFRSELESRGELALSASAIQRALDDAEDEFDTLLGRGRTPRAVAEALGRPSRRAEIMIATRLLRLRPGSATGPELVTYLRVIRALAIAAPLILLSTLILPIILIASVVVAIGTCALEFGLGVEVGLATLVVLYVLRGGVMIVVWRWARWNVGRILQRM